MSSPAFDALVVGSGLPIAPVHERRDPADFSGVLAVLVCLACVAAVIITARMLRADGHPEAADLLSGDRLWLALAYSTGFLVGVPTGIFGATFPTWRERRKPIRTFFQAVGTFVAGLAFTLLAALDVFDHDARIRRNELGAALLAGLLVGAGLILIIPAFVRMVRRPA